jgi:hypothetical protein
MAKFFKEICLYDIPCEIEYAYYKAYRGARDGRYGPPLEPDEPAHVEIEQVTFNGADVTKHISDEDMEKLTQSIFDEIESSKYEE